MVSLIVCIAGTLGMVSMITLIGSRSLFVENSEAAIARRLSLWNSRALTKEYLLSGPILAGNADEAVLSLGGEWGTATVPVFVSLPLESVEEFTLMNRLGPGGTAGFTADIEVAMANGAIDIPYLIQMKSRSTFFSGELLTLHRLETGGSGAVDVNNSLAVQGKTMFWDNDSLSLASFSTGSFEYPDIIGVTVHDTLGEAQPASNFPSYYRTSGPSGGVPSLNGQFNHLVGDGPNTLAYKMNAAGGSIPVQGDEELNISGVTSDGLGTVTIDLKNHTLSQVMVGNDVNHLVFVGQADLAEYSAASTLSPVSVLVDSTGSLAGNYLDEVRFIGDNSRAVILGIHRQSSAAMSNLSIVLDRSVGLQNLWRMLITAEHSPLLFDVTGHTSGRIVGGIRTDREITVIDGDGITLLPDESPGLLERMDPRSAWIEIYSQS